MYLSKTNAEWTNFEWTKIFSKKILATLYVQMLKFCQNTGYPKYK